MTSLWQQAAQATWVEALKARRSKLPLFTGLVVDEEDLERYFLRLIGRQGSEPA